MIHAEDDQICELYVDSFFQNEGIGSRLVDFAVNKLHANRLFVLEKNESTIRFYQSHGFLLTGKREPEPDTPEFIVEMECPVT